LPELGADTRFDIVELDFATASSRGNNTFIIGLDVGTTLDSVGPIQDHFPLGGFLRLSGLERGQISGPHAALARLIYYRQLNSPAGLVQFPVYLGGSIEAGNTWQDRHDVSVDSMLINGSLFFGLDTPIGPFYLAVGIAENGSTRFYLFLGATPL
jgi:NTE family protein